jgi:hypothetical protein
VAHPIIRQIVFDKNKLLYVWILFIKNAFN